MLFNHATGGAREETLWNKRIQRATRNATNRLVIIPHRTFTKSKSKSFLPPVFSFQKLPIRCSCTLVHSGTYNQTR